MKPNPVVWFEIYVQDMERAKAFYEAVLGTRLQRLPAPSGSDGSSAGFEMEMWAFPMEQACDKGYGAAGALVQMSAVPSGPGGTMVYFSCDDCAVEASRAPDSGGSVFRDKMPIGEHGFIAIISDTEGNMVGLHSMK